MGPPFGHGFVGTGDSRRYADGLATAGLRRYPGPDSPGSPNCETEDSILFRVPSPKVGAEHARYLGTGCSDR